METQTALTTTRAELRSVQAKLASNTEYMTNLEDQVEETREQLIELESRLQLETARLSTQLTEERQHWYAVQADLEAQLKAALDQQAALHAETKVHSYLCDEIIFPVVAPAHVCNKNL